MNGSLFKGWKMRFQGVEGTKEKKKGRSIFLKNYLCLQSTRDLTRILFSPIEFGLSKIKKKFNKSFGKPLQSLYASVHIGIVMRTSQVSMSMCLLKQKKNLRREEHI